ncbi:MAG: hypothetical protein ACOYI7_06065 [Candidatus Excrementavichristensenella sp.]
MSFWIEMPWLVSTMAASALNGMMLKNINKAIASAICFLNCLYMW